MFIHPTSIVAPSAQLAADVTIGPFCVIEDQVQLGSRCQLASGVVIKRGVKMGSDNRIEVGAVIGGDPQHLGAGEVVGGLEIGDRNQFREYTTVHRAYQPGMLTRIGDDNLLMVSSHVGHDCLVGNRNVLANNVMLAGHVEMEDRNYIGGGAAFHQFCRVGSYTMVGGLAQVKRDVPPFVMVDGGSGCLVGLNLVGLQRAGISAAVRQDLKAAYRLAFRSGLPWGEKMTALKHEFPDAPVSQLWRFLAGGTRGSLVDRRGERRPRRDESSPSTPRETASDGRDRSEMPVTIPFRRAS